MKKDLGSLPALYPTPVIVVGAMVNGKPNWTLVAHTGITSHDKVMVSLAKAHYINSGIKESKMLSVNIVDESWLDKADYTGSVSGAKTDKSDVFEYTIGETGAPMINEALLTMECTVEDIYLCGPFENFICSIKHTFAEETIVTEDGKKIDYDKFKPVLFNFPQYTYLKTGDTIAKCLSIYKK